MVSECVKEGSDQFAGLEKGIPEETMTARCEGYVGELCGLGRKIAPGRGGCPRWED